MPSPGLFLCIVGQAGGRFYLYARSNPELSGHRSVQVCSGDTLTGLGAFRMCTFDGVPTGSDVYFARAYVPPSKRCVAVLMSLAYAEGAKQPAGVYVAISFDGVHFRVYSY